MMYLISYDITENYRRTRLAKLLISEGYERLQLSVFAGPFSPMDNSRLWQKITELCTSNSENGKVSENKLMVIEVPLALFSRMRLIGTSGQDMEYLTGKRHTLWL